MGYPPQQYPPQQYPPQGQPPINNNMTMSIVSIFLFWPLAIPAIIAASKVNPALQTGDFATAQQAATDSKKWSKLALIVGLCWYGVVLLCCVGYFVLFAASATTSSLTTQ
jgi:Interferon-induced transmembrane protein